MADREHHLLIFHGWAQNEKVVRFKMEKILKVRTSWIDRVHVL